jgi:hypothetical protein
MPINALRTSLPRLPERACLKRKSSFLAYGLCSGSRFARLPIFLTIGSSGDEASPNTFAKERDSR